MKRHFRREEQEPAEWGSAELVSEEEVVTDHWKYPTNSGAGPRNFSVRIHLTRLTAQN